jgi:uncharacterized membrane protein YgdD (TMEM256/DUF423 family)
MSRFDETPRAELGIAAAAALLGAAGVVLGSVAAHRIPDASLALAANYLIMHAATVIAIAAWSVRSESGGTLWRSSARVMLLGAALFCGDIAARKIGGFGLFPMAAPTGGIALILGWVLAAIAAAIDWRRAG